MGNLNVSAWVLYWQSKHFLGNNLPGWLRKSIKVEKSYCNDCWHNWRYGCSGLRNWSIDAWFQHIYLWMDIRLSITDLYFISNYNNPICNYFIRRTSRNKTHKKNGKVTFKILSRSCPSTVWAFTRSQTPKFSFHLSEHLQLLNCSHKV